MKRCINRIKVGDKSEICGRPTDGYYCEDCKDELYPKENKNGSSWEQKKAYIFKRFKELAVEARVNDARSMAENAKAQKKIEQTMF